MARIFLRRNKKLDHKMSVNKVNLKRELLTLLSIRQSTNTAITNQHCAIRGPT